MIDIENKILDEIQTAFASEDITVSSSYVYMPETFPWAYVNCNSNTTYRKTRDVNKSERHVRLAIHIEIYTNQPTGSKAEAKRLLDIADDKMQSLNFTRNSYGVIPNYDRNMARIYADYDGIVGDKKTANGNTSYRVYRR